MCDQGNVGIGNGLIMRSKKVQGWIPGWLRILQEMSMSSLCLWVSTMSAGYLSGSFRWITDANLALDVAVSVFLCLLCNGLAN